MNTSSLLRNTIARNPSHLGSNRKSPSRGISSATFASMGSTGGRTGNDLRDIFLTLRSNSQPRGGFSSPPELCIALPAMNRRSALLLALAAALAGAAAPAGAQATPPAKHYTPADVHFMAGMIGHHAQAIAMAKWAPTHGASPAVQRLCERIVVGPTTKTRSPSRGCPNPGKTVRPP